MNQNQFWTYTKEEFLREFQVTETGLNIQQVEEIRAEKGENVLQEEKKKSVVQVFLGQLETIVFTKCQSNPGWQEDRNTVEGSGAGRFCIVGDRRYDCGGWVYTSQLFSAGE